MRQCLADKINGNLAGIWLLVAEHLRLGTWDLLCGWTGQPTERVEPRLGLQLVHEAAVCTTGIRSDRTLFGRAGFELANGLPFVANDVAIHELLAQHTVEDSRKLQAALGRLRRASGHFCGKLLAIDPHRVLSYTKRRTRQRVEKPATKPAKMVPTFWVLDADTYQPVCFTHATAASTVADVTPQLIALAEEILQPSPGQTLILADAEHFTSELVHQIHRDTRCDLLVPIPNRQSQQKRLKAIEPSQFKRRWAGFATAKVPHQFTRGPSDTYWQFVQRTGERPSEWCYRGYLCTSDRHEVDTLTLDYPKRWHIEEFFNANQALGWKRAGTQNLNIRYGQMTMALIAQAALHQLRCRLGEPHCRWDANHFAKDIFHRLEGDVRVSHDRIIVTFYNAPDAERLATHYQDLPDKLAQENIDPNVPWLYGYKLDFHFR